MAIIQNPIIGRSRNLAGGMVFSTGHGKNVMRSKPFSYNDKNSDEQQTQRTRFTLIMKMMVFLKAFFDNLFLYKPSGRTMFATAISQLFAEESNFNDVTGYLEDAANLILGNGNIVSDGAYDVELDLAVPEAIFTWAAGSTPQIEPTMPVNGLLINLTQRDVQLYENMAIDSALSVAVAPPSSWDVRDVIVGFIQWQNVAGDLRSPFYGCMTA